MFTVPGVALETSRGPLGFCRRPLIRFLFWFTNRKPLPALAVVLSSVILAGCAPSAMSGTRQQIAAHQYVAAHRQLVALLEHPDRLTPDELREARDSLCLTEFKIGPPTYPLREQRRVCAEAADGGGRQSREILAAIDNSMRSDAERRVEQALRRRDVADAEDAAFEYQSVPGADRRKIAHWSQTMWLIVRQQNKHLDAHHRRSLHRTIAKLRRKYTKKRRMNSETFLRWVTKQGLIDGGTIFYPVGLTRSRLTLAVEPRNIHAASLNLGRFTAVNDALAARCGCNAHTEVALSETGFPLYEVFVDPRLESSELLIISHR